jgi:hypothetical protein
VDVAATLQIRARQSVAMIAKPDGVDLPIPLDCSAGSMDTADVVIVFLATGVDLPTAGGPALVAGRADRLAWVAYPKAGRLGTDLNRDRLRELLTDHGVQPVRQVSIDETWSALRIRPS